MFNLWCVVHFSVDTDGQTYDRQTLALLKLFTYFFSVVRLFKRLI